MRTYLGSLSVVPLVLALSACARVEGASDGQVGVVVAEAALQCGDTDDSQEIETYAGSLGPWARNQESPIGIQVKSSIRGCTGTLISRDLFLSAGSCAYAVGDQVEFNYVNNADGALKSTRSYLVRAIVEQEANANFNYAIVRLDGNPGTEFGKAPIAKLDPIPGATVYAYQHPNGRPKRLAGGRVVDNSSPLGANWFRHQVDTAVGSTGAGILNAQGYLIGIHTDEGCSTSGSNSAMRMTALVEHSNTLRGLVKHEYIRQPAIWANAQLDCAARGGHLATVESIDENALLRELVLAQDANASAWIGLSDAKSEGSFEWVTGNALSSMPFSVWNAGEPNNAGGGENYVHLQVSSDSSIATWNDLGAAATLNYICEYGDYEVVTETKNWDAADKDCTARGGDLLVIDSAYENDLIKDFLTGRSGESWLGYTDAGHEGVWTSTTGAMRYSVYTNWGPGEPNNAGGNENYTQFRVNDGSWNDLWNSTLPYVCDYTRPGRTVRGLAAWCSGGSDCGNLVDGNHTTGWETPGTGFDWFYVDLGAARTISRWVVWHNGVTPNFADVWNTRNFKLQVLTRLQQTDDWVDVDVVTDNVQDITDRDMHPVTGRFFRLVVTTGGNANQGWDGNVRIQDIELHQAPRNLALGKPVTASSYVSNEAPERAVDGSTSEWSDQSSAFTGNSKWCAANTGAKWLQVDLGQVEYISKWVVRHAGAGVETPSWNTRDFKLRGSLDGSTWQDVDTVTNNRANTTNRNLSTATPMRYAQLYVTNAGADNVARIYEFQLYGAAINTPPPTSIQETPVEWIGHSEKLTRVQYDPDVAVFFNPEFFQSDGATLTDPSEAQFGLTFNKQLWNYYQRTYGSFGLQNQLWVRGHRNGSDGRGDCYYDHAFNRNWIDIALSHPWADVPGHFTKDYMTHEMGHIVEWGHNDSTNKFGLGIYAFWGDSAYNAIMQYDAYVGLGRTADATAFLAWANNGGWQDTPATYSYWFGKFLYPIWRDYGRSVPLARYFQLTRQYFPKELGYYGRAINFGEFIHFMSRAACADVMPLAKGAFTPWDANWDSQYAQAKLDFPGMGQCEQELIDLGAASSSAYMTLAVNGESMLDVTQLPTSYTPSSVRITFATNDGTSLSGVTFQQSGSLTNLTGSSKIVTIPLAGQTRLRAFIRADVSRSVKVRWTAVR